ncbi:hypothetical protein BKA62DRAFT_703734 [Auriculariales sp. MPI-PUGE-AT-0066]|nr:hypothetical protein BKA62DRAFT_703734 [Auriculariales sp. MPI-PUGE-AT-0066]
MSALSAAQVTQLLAIIQTARPTIQLWLRACLIGVLVASCVFGVNMGQLYTYLTSPRRDSRCVVTFVCLVCLLDASHTGSIWAWLYGYVVEDAADITRTLRVFDMTNALAISVVLSGFMGASVQSYYAWRLYRLSRKPCISVVSWTGSLARAALSIAVAVLSRQAQTLYTYTTKYKWTILGVLGVSVGVDVFNAVSICVFLARHRDGQSRTATMISKLTAWTIESGMLTSAFGITILCLVLTDNSILVPAMLHIYAKLFVFTLLATLNGRDHLRQTLALSGALVTPISASPPAFAVDTSPQDTKDTGLELHSRGLTEDHAHGEPNFKSSRYLLEGEHMKAIVPWETMHPPLSTPRTVVHRDMVL